MDARAINEEKHRGALMADRFRSFMPVVIDVETAGFNAETDALLEIAAVLLEMDEKGRWTVEQTISRHVEPFEGANLDPASLEFIKIDVNHPFRKQIAVPEKQALTDIFTVVKKKLKQHQCTRAILTGHNASFDLAFLNAAVKRTEITRNPFHSFSCFDTATLAGVAYGQTVLLRAVAAAGMEWNSERAHSASYDAEKTAALFCQIINHWAKIT